VSILAWPHNNALKLTKGAEVRAQRHFAPLRAVSVPQRTFFTNVPSQLIRGVGQTWVGNTAVPPYGHRLSV
jgi:hypothetical protein